MKRQRYWPRRRYAAAALGAVLFGVAGYIGLYHSHAATFATSLEAEAGTVVGAAKVADNAASGGSAIRFQHLNRYVALGDSVASGEGINYGWKWSGGTAGSWQRTGPANPVWEPASDASPATQDCHRSLQAYPYLLAAATGSPLYNPSCSGSSIPNGVLGAHVFDSTTTGIAQLGNSDPSKTGYATPNLAYDAAKPDVVTVTLGMDDIDFGQILQWCYLGPSCATSTNDGYVADRINTLQANLTQMLKEIQTRGTAAGTVPSVVLTTYYDPFPADPTVSCKDLYLGLGQGIDATEVNWLRQKMQLMNGAIRAAAATYPKSKVVDLSPAIAGHTFCSADPWVYGISIWYSSYGNPAPFHPTPEAQAAIAQLLLPVLRQL